MTLTVLWAEPFRTAVVWMGRAAALATLVNAIELLQLRRLLSDAGVWRAAILAPRWGAMRPLLEERGFVLILLLQCAAAAALAIAAGSPVGCMAAATLALCTLLAAARFRGTVNGGSDGMLFTVLAGLILAQWPDASTRVREAGLLYVAAQLTLSYLRAAFVKLRQPSWWTGDAIAGFVDLPAYGVPSWVPRGGVLLRIVSVGVMLFECSAALAWIDTRWCIAFLALAIAFHSATALVLGLNRFLLAWGAAMPALWFAVHRVH